MVPLLKADPETFIDFGGWTQRNGSLGMRLANVDAKLVRRRFTKHWATFVTQRDGLDFGQGRQSTSAGCLSAGQHQEGGSFAIRFQPSHDRHFNFSSGQGRVPVIRK